MAYRGRVIVASWIVALLGLWEAGDVLAFFTPGFGSVSAAVVNHVVVGVVLMVLGAGAATTSSVRAARAMHLAAAAAGAWLVLATLLLRSTQVSLAHLNDFVVGVVVVLVGLWAARRDGG